jgi:phosphohistidine phosphatase
MLRHGEAGTHSQSSEDWRRPLTEQGVEKLHKQAKKMLKWNLKFDRIISSPFTRAVQTAEIVAEAYGMTVHEDERLGSALFTYPQLTALCAENSRIENLLIAGHEPDFSSVLGQVLGGAHVNFVKGGLACVELTRLEPPAGPLIFFATPEMQGA